MRPPVDADRVQQLARELARALQTPVTLYLTGGSTAVLEGWRPSTADIDLRLEPETDELVRRLSGLKDELDINVELVSPPDFVPELPGWRDRSPFVLREGNLTVRHFDPYSQGLSKIERGFEQDLTDVRSMVESGLIDPARARALYEEAAEQLFRYPAIDPASLARKIADALPE